MGPRELKELRGRHRGNSTPYCVFEFCGNGRCYRERQLRMAIIKGGLCISRSRVFTYELDQTGSLNCGNCCAEDLGTCVLVYVIVVDDFSTWAILSRNRSSKKRARNFLIRVTYFFSSTFLAACLST